MDYLLPYISDYLGDARLALLIKSLNACALNYKNIVGDQGGYLQCSIYKQ